MIPIPAGWSVRRCEDSLLLLPPAGAEVGAVRYVERLRPLGRAVDLVRAAPAPQGFHETRLGRPERLITAEGEHAAFVVSEGTIAGVLVERPFGFVFGDDFCSRIAGVALGPAGFAPMRAAVRDLTLADRHELGVRRRRFVYAPPPGWHGLAGLFDATWYPRDYPAARAAITVCPAVPAQDGLCAALLDAVLAGRPLAEMQAGAVVQVSTRAGLTGLRWRLRRSAELETEVVLLEDATYVYAMRLDAAAGFAAARAAFDAVVASVEPLPGRVRDSARVVAALGQWSD